MQRINLAAFLLSSLLLTGCASHRAADTNTLAGLQALATSQTGIPDASGGVGHIRRQALEDTALSLGAQGGLAWAADEIDGRLEKDRWQLETIYNFNGMLLPHAVMPPVLVESNNNANLADPDTLRVSDKTYEIVKQARFVTTPPNWREYIWLHYSKPALPDRVLLPRTNAERKLWRDAVSRGWQKGIEQAYSIFQQNLARLKRDYSGMILYRKLLQEHMVSAPYVSHTDLGVTGDGANMHINDQVLRITVLPKLQTDSNSWHAIVVKHD